MGKDANEVRREIAETRARMDDTVEALSYKADVPARMKDAVNERVETVKGTIGDVMENVLVGVAEVVSDATERAGTVLSEAQRVAAYKLNDAAALTEKLPSAPEMRAAAQRGAGMFAENPLGLMLGALGAGFVAGLILPVTTYERETVGPLRDDLLDRAQSVGSDALEHGKQVLAETAQAALQTAQESAQRHVQQVAKDVSA